jgi:hypothetical protein
LNHSSPAWTLLIGFVHSVNCRAFPEVVLSIQELAGDANELAVTSTASSETCLMDDMEPLMANGSSQYRSIRA